MDKIIDLIKKDYRITFMLYTQPNTLAVRVSRENWNSYFRIHLDDCFLEKQIDIGLEDAAKRIEESLNKENKHE